MDKYVDKYFEKNLNNQTKSHIYLNDIKIATVNNNNNPYYILSDHLSSSSILIDSTGTTAQLSDYKPFGSINYENEIFDLKDDYKYTGREYDDESSLQYYGARYLDNQLGKFASIDPVSIDYVEKYLSNPQELNGYAYAMNNPLIYIDPLGLYNIKTGEIEKGDTQDSITALINKTFNINTNWDTIADVSFYQTRLEGKPIDELVGKSLRIGTDVTVDITDQLNSLNTDRAKVASKFGPVSLINFRTNGPWDIKNSSDNILGKSEDGKRDYWSYIYNGELIRYDAPGNINYGYVSRSSGMWGWQTQGVAAGEQIGSNISTGKIPSFADNAGDSRYVQIGINLFNSSRPWWQRLSW